MQNTQNNLSSLALQKAEDNKKEITYIYSQLNKMQTEVEQLKNNENVSGGENTPENEENNSSSSVFDYCTASTSLVCPACATYHIRDFSDPVNIFYLTFYSPIDQFVQYNQNIYFHYTYISGSGSTAIWFDYYFNDCLFAQRSTSLSTSNCYHNITYQPFFMKKGYNQLKIVVTKNPEVDYIHMGTVQFYIYGYNISLLNENVQKVQLTYNSNTTYFLYHNGSYLYLKEFETNADKTDFLSATSVKTITSSYGGSDVNTLFVFNPNTNTFDKKFIVYTSHPHLTFNVTLLPDNKSVGNTENTRCGIIASSTAENTMYKGFQITSEGIAKLLHCNLKLVRTSEDITEKFTKLFTLSDIKELKVVKIIDELYLPREICFAVKTHENQNFLVYNIEGENPQVLDIGFGGNIQLYYHNKNIFFFIFKEGATYVNFLKYNEQNDCYEMLNNQTYVGNFKNVYATNYETWLTYKNFNALHKLNITPFYKFE